MVETAKRRFTLVDMMILVAALAVGIVLTRPLWSNVRESLSQGAYVHGVALLTPSAAMLTLALIPWRLLPPRPARRRLRRRAGWVLGTTCSAVLLWGGVFPGIFMPLVAQQPTDQLLPLILLLLPLVVSQGVLASWLIPRIFGVSMIYGDWVDWVAWVLGWFWVISLPLCLWTLVR